MTRSDASGIEVVLQSEDPKIENGALATRARRILLEVPPAVSVRVSASVESESWVSIPLASADGGDSH